MWYLPEQMLSGPGAPVPAQGSMGTSPPARLRGISWVREEGAMGKTISLKL